MKKVTTRTLTPVSSDKKKIRKSSSSSEKDTRKTQKDYSGMSTHDLVSEAFSIIEEHLAQDKDKSSDKIAVKKSPFEDKIWKLEDLKPQDRKFAKNMGCEKGKVYFGDPGDELEVPQCPFCGTIVWEETRCGHLVFIYDATNGEWEELNEPFKQRYISDEEPECPETLSDKIKGLQLYEIYHWSGCMGTIWGFMKTQPPKKKGGQILTPSTDPSSSLNT